METVDYIPEEEQDGGYFLSSDEKDAVAAIWRAFGKPTPNMGYYDTFIKQVAEVLMELNELMTSNYPIEEVSSVVKKYMSSLIDDDDDIPF